MLLVIYLVGMLVFDTVLLLVLFAGLSTASFLPGHLAVVAMLTALAIAAYAQVRAFWFLERVFNGRK